MTGIIFELMLVVAIIFVMGMGLITKLSQLIGVLAAIERQIGRLTRDGRIE